MSVTLLVLIAGFLSCLALIGISRVLATKQRSTPGSPRGSGQGAFTSVALFGLIGIWALPQMIYEYGLPAGYGALMIIAMTVVMTLLSKRLWVLTRRHQLSSQATLLRVYFQDDGMAGLASILNSFTCLVLLALIFHLVGRVSSLATGWGIFGFYIGVTAIAVAGYLYNAHLQSASKAVAPTMIFVIYIAGMIMLGFAVLSHAGGFTGLGSELAQHVASAGKYPTTLGHGGGDFPVLLALSGVYQNVMNIPTDFYVGSPWTGSMILSATICALGVCVSQIGFGQMIGGADTRHQSNDQLIRFALLGGGIAIIFSVAMGVGAVVGVDLDILKIMAGESAQIDGIVFRLGISVFGLLVFISATAVILRAIDAPSSQLEEAITKPRLKTAMITVLAGLLAFTPLVQIIDYATLALALSAQLLVLFFAMCWAPWFTRMGIYAGLVSGLITVLLTELPGALIQQSVLGEAIWGASPMTMHAAGWGLMVNIIVAITVSAITQSRDDLSHRMTFHADLKTYAAIEEEARGLIPVAWIFTIAWFLFALGPGAVIGNSIFGAPDQPTQGWNFPVPSIWAWQIFMWGLGVALVWFLATRLGVSRAVDGKVEPLDGPSQESG